jgi:hypothetical protein
MGKRNSTPVKSKKHTIRSKGVTSKPQEQVPHEREENRSNFGGISDRDLKKNLGCG